MSDTALIERISKIEEELVELKTLLAKNKESNQVLQLKGLLKGVHISEEDITKARKSLFKD
ncbi:MAG: hypothetical protein ACXAD7_24300 [Candidatus Kariarchaeaceae archaeon]